MRMSKSPVNSCHPSMGYNSKWHELGSCYVGKLNLTDFFMPLCLKGISFKEVYKRNIF